MTEENEIKDESEFAEVSDTSMIEAVLFMHGAPVAFSKIGKIIDRDLDAVRDGVEILAASYVEREAGIRIIIKDDAAQFVTSSDHADIIEKFTRKELDGDLSNAALEVLAIVAYRGPLSKPDIEAIRGVNCAFTLRNLLLRGLVERVAHPTDQRTKLYRVTFDFLRSIGRESVDSLPQFQELAGDKRIDAILYSTHDEEAQDENEE